MMTAVALSSLTSCADPAAAAKKRLEMTKRIGTLGDACAAATALSDIYLKNHDEVDYMMARQEATLKCQQAAAEGPLSPASDEIRAKASAAAMQVAQDAARGAAEAANSR